MAVGWDYADVPPTRGVFAGNTQETLSVGMRAALTDALVKPDEVIFPEKTLNTAVSKNRENKLTTAAAVKRQSYVQTSYI